MAYTTDGKAVMLGAIRTAIDEISLHSADPGITGTNEVTGGSPAYARYDATATDTSAIWTAVSGGAFELVDDITFDGPASGAVTYFGVWESSTFLGSGAITGDTNFNADGEFVLQAGTSLDLNLECS